MFDFRDFDGDGDVSLVEDYLSYRVYEDVTGDSDDDWRDDIDIKLNDFDLDPDDYDSREEFFEAVEEAKEQYSWRENYSYNIDHDLDPEDFDTEEDFLDAISETADNYEAESGIESIEYKSDDTSDAESKTVEEQEMPETKQQNTFDTEEYFDYWDDILFGKAIKDNFGIRMSFSDNDTDFTEIMRQIAWKDQRLALEIWEGCYDGLFHKCTKDKQRGSLTTDIIGCLDDMPIGFTLTLLNHIKEKPSFSGKVIATAPKLIYGMPQFTAEAIKRRNKEAAVTVFRDAIASTKGNGVAIYDYVKDVYEECRTWDELESMEFFRDNLFPIVKRIDDSNLQKYADVWEKEIAEYIAEVEASCDKYAYTRRNKWRTEATEAKKYGLDPLYYDTEEEYLEELNERKYRWRRSYEYGNQYGLNTEDYETQAEFLAARNEAREKDIKENQEKQRKAEEKEKDTNIYNYCGVTFAGSNIVFNYLTGEILPEIGDIVIVPAGRDNRESEATVVSIGKYTRKAAPYPVESTKHIIRIKTESSDNT